MKITGLRLVFIVLVIAILNHVQAKHTQHNDPIVIEVNKNLEFLGYALHIGEPSIENTAVSDLYPIRELLDEKRARFHTDELFLDIFTLSEDFSYTFFVELFLLMDEMPHKRKVDIPSRFLLKHHLDTLADRTLLTELLKKVNAFYQKSEFESFWKATQPYYNRLLSRTQAAKPSEKLLTVMENFYDKEFLAYKIVPSLTFWSAGFGIELTENQTAIFAFGTLGNPNSFNPNFFKTLVIHEFGHSFANSQLSANCSDLITETQSLYEPIKYSMTTQGYPNWPYCVDEHFVRAGEILIPELMNEPNLSERNLATNRGKGFRYIEFIVDRLREYRIQQGLAFQQSIQKTMSDLKNKYL